MKEASLYKVKVTIGDASVEIEGAEQGVVEIVKALKDIFTHRQAPGGPPPSSAPTSTSQPLSRPALTDIRSFFTEKAPTNDIEAVTTVAYYLQYLARNNERSETVNSQQLEQAFHHAGWSKPKVITQTLRNTKQAGYIDSAGEPGEYRLNPVGYNLVAHTLGEPREGKLAPKRRTLKRKTSSKKRLARRSTHHTRKAKKKRLKKSR